MIIFEEQGMDLKISDTNNLIPRIVFFKIGVFIGHEKLLYKDENNDTITIKNFEPIKLFQQLVNCMEIKEYNYIKKDIK